MILPLQLGLCPRILGGLASHGGSQTINLRLPTDLEIQDLTLNAGIACGTNMMQVLFDPMVTGKTGGN